MKNTKKISLLLAVNLAFMVMSSCHGNDKGQKQENQTTEKQETISFAELDIAKMVDESNYEHFSDFCILDSKGDTILSPAECDSLIIESLKKPCLNLVSDVDQYLDSVGEISGMPVYDSYHGDSAVKVVDQAVHELRRFQTGERKYYPKEEVGGALDMMSFGLNWDCGHGGTAPIVYYYLCFVQQAALLCPNVDFICETHSPDNQVGLRSVWGCGWPIMTYLLHKTDGHCTMQMVCASEDLSKVFQIEDDFGKQYYLLMGNLGSASSPAVYLYEKKNDEIVLFERKDFPLLEMMDDEYYWNREIVYNPEHHRWDLCYQEGEYWHKFEGTKSLYLHLDGEKPYFEVH